jgi:hypothetical protein
MRSTIETQIGTTIVESSKRVFNPIKGEHQDLSKLSEEGYCRRFLAVLSAYNSPSVVDLDSSPIVTFDKSRWKLSEDDGHYIIEKREPETDLDEMVMDDE